MKQQEVKSVLKSAIEASTSSELEPLLNKHIPARYHMSEIKYPVLKFEISAQELASINVSSEEAQTVDFNFAFQYQLKTPLEKLFYAVLWKQGDLSKLTHILRGIENRSVKPTKKAGIVFRNFGEHLRDKNIPIIDQHCIRAFGVYQAKNDDEAQKFLKIETLIDNDETRTLVRDYQVFFNEAVNWKNR